MHTSSYSLLTTNERLRKQLPSPRISHETISKITKPSTVIASSGSKISKKKPPLKIAIVKNNGYSRSNNLLVDHVKGDLVELIHSKVSVSETDKSNNNIKISTAQCCFATPKSATFFTVKSTTTHALNSLTKPLTPLLREHTNFTPLSPTTTFELNNNCGLSITDNNSSMANATTAVNPFGALAGYNFNFFEVNDIGTPVNAAHEYSLKLGELLASFSNAGSTPTTVVSTVSTGNSKPTAATPSAVPPASRIVPTDFNKPEQPPLSLKSSGVAATCITPARTHFLFSRIAGNLSQPSHQTIFEESEMSEPQLQGSFLSSLSTSPSSSPSPLLNSSTEQPVVLYEPMVVIEAGPDGYEESPQSLSQYYQHYQVELLSTYPEYLFPIVIPQQQVLSPHPAKDLTNSPLSSFAANPACFNLQTHANFLSPTVGLFPLQQQHHLQHQAIPESVFAPSQADPQSVSPTTYQQPPCENYFYQDQQAMVHQQQVPYIADQSYSSQSSQPQYNLFSTDVSINESNYAPSSLSSPLGCLSPCSSETSYEPSLILENSPLSDEATSNDSYYDNGRKKTDKEEDDEEEEEEEEKLEKKNKKKKLRENKAWTNPMVMAGLHVSLMHENPLRTKKALPGKKGKYFCSHCKGQFRTILDLCAHMDAVVVSRPFHCPNTDCPWHIAGFPTASEWCRHTRFQHRNEADRDAQKLACENCGKKFTRKDSLKRHYILVHDNENSRYNSKLRKMEERRLKKKKLQQQQQCQ
jgi:hypothetical protein